MRMLQVGEKAPDFVLTDQDQNEVQLSKYADGQNAVLIFYPADFTPI